MRTDASSSDISCTWTELSYCPFSICFYSILSLLKAFIYQVSPTSSTLVSLSEITNFIYNSCNFNCCSKCFLSNSACDVDPQSLLSFLNYWKASINILNTSHGQILYCERSETWHFSAPYLKQLWLSCSAFHKEAQLQIAVRFYKHFFTGFHIMLWETCPANRIPIQTLPNPPLKYRSIVPQPLQKNTTSINYTHKVHDNYWLP